MGSALSGFRRNGWDTASLCPGELSPSSAHKARGRRETPSRCSFCLSTLGGRRKHPASLDVSIQRAGSEHAYSTPAVRGADSAEKAGGTAGPLPSDLQAQMPSWPDALSSPLLRPPPPPGTQGLSWTSGAPRRTGEGHSLSPALLTLPLPCPPRPAPPLSDPGLLPGPRSMSEPQNQAALPPMGSLPTAPRSPPSRLDPEELESAPSRRWHEALDRSQSRE